MPALSALAILMPLAPAVIVPKTANVVAGAVITVLLVAPVVALRRKRWASRTGAALLTLLAVAAAVPPVSGLGRPTSEEIQRYVAVQVALGRPVDLHGGALGSLPWDDTDLLLLAVACLATAALLLMLGRAVHQDGRRELRPLRWRWPLVMWGAALLLVSVPQTMVVLAAGTAEHGMIVMDGSCFGALEEILLWPAMAMVILLPQPLVVALGFALWALLARTGHRLLGRAVGWLTLAPLLAADLMMTWMPLLGCTRSPADPITLTWALFTFLPVVLIVLAVRVRRVA
ncbi:hypothetical protein [Nonomuraea sp. C10]|uniref:hypothetical protein n=1 Tax=Nonomuraea sp. C10 TaxID=2600577 RepID=UPI0011CE891D|nr:hypothetical protein [Nonomuraea sp. C10]TXK34338.1 hypothetical protein FR742_33775 [Nonomuraea sp. C10]